MCDEHDELKKRVDELEFLVYRLVLANHLSAQFASTKMSKFFTHTEIKKIAADLQKRPLPLRP